MRIEFAITYCCQELGMAILNREWWFSIDTTNGKCSLTDVNDEKDRDNCPFCNKNMEDVLDVDIEGITTTL